MIRVKSIWRCTFVALALIATAAGCGDDDDTVASEDPATDSNGESSETSDATGEELVIGLLAPITGGGAGVGEQAQLGAKFAEEQINENGGIDGRPVRLVVADTQGDPTAGVSAARRLLTQEDIDFAIGPAYSQVTLATLPLFTDADLFTVNVTGSEDLTPEQAPRSFSLLVNASSQVEILVQEAEAQGHTSVAFISDNGPQAQSALEAAEQMLQDAGIELTGSQQYAYDATDMTPPMLDLRNGNPDALLAFTSTGDHSGYILQAREQLNWDIPVIGGYGYALSGPAIEIAGEDAFEDVTGVNYSAFTFCEDEGMPEPVEEFIAGVQEFDSTLASRVDLNYVSLWHDALYVIKQAVEANDGATDGATLTEWLEGGATVNEDAGVNRSLSASEDDHFLIGVDQLAVVHPAELLEGGVQQRVHCD